MSSFCLSTFGPNTLHIFFFCSSLVFSLANSAFDQCLERSLIIVSSTFDRNIQLMEVTAKQWIFYDLLVHPRINQEAFF